MLSIKKINPYIALRNLSHFIVTNDQSSIASASEIAIMARRFVKDKLLKNEGINIRFLVQLTEELSTKQRDFILENIQVTKLPLNPRSILERVQLF